ncbi:MAG: hypothetical protein WCG27_00890 [Pseudomonadota bacterium]
MKFIILSLLFLAGCSSFLPKPEYGYAISFNFDWDDSLVVMPTDRPKGEENYSLNDLKKTVVEDPRGFKGPMFIYLAWALKRPGTVQYTSIITGRGHDPQVMSQGLNFLKEKGFIQSVIPENNIWAVTNPNFAKRFQKIFDKKLPAEALTDVSVAKAMVMEAQLDKINKIVIPNVVPSIIAPEGDMIGRYHLWFFSDDDYGNFQKALEVLQKGINEDRWPQVKIILFFTGQNDSQQKPRAVVLRKNDGPRPWKEKDELKTLVSTL